MTVLVTAGTRHGATREIAEAIAATLEEEGVPAEALPLEEVGPLAPYDAVVLGSAVYVGRWLDTSRRFAAKHEEELAARPVWLFSSGPIGAPPKPEEDKAVSVDDLVEAIHPREHRVFTGKVDRSTLGFGERAVMTAVRAQEGDFRDWDAIAAWAREIAAALRAPASAEAPIASPTG